MNQTTDLILRRNLHMITIKQLILSSFWPITSPTKPIHSPTEVRNLTTKILIIGI
jgi:hypothetical protein